MKTRDLACRIQPLLLPPTALGHQPQAESSGSAEAVLAATLSRAARRLLPSLCLAFLVLGAADGPDSKFSAVAGGPSDPSAPAKRSSVVQPVRPAVFSPVPGVMGNGNRVTNMTAVPTGRNMDALDDKQKLAVGDRVSFRVLEDQEEPKALTITDAGELDVPELGLIAAAGKTCKQLAFEIKPKLEATTYYHATVIIGIDLLNKTMSGRRLYVGGQVVRAGPQEIPAGETWTVTKAIMRAGGFTPYADRKGVRLVRAGANGARGQTFTLNVLEVWEKGRTELDLPVQPEDLVYVPTRAVNF